MNPVQHDESEGGSERPGFVRLAAMLPPVLTLTQGRERQTFTAAALEAELALPGLAAKLTALAARCPVHSVTQRPVENFVGGKGGLKQRSLSLSANAAKEMKFRNALAFQEGPTIQKSSKPVAQAPAVDNGAAAERLAHHLATALGGANSLSHLPFYRKVVRTVPRSIILDAFGRARDARNVRKTRAHLFAYLIRPHLIRPSHPNIP